ncbi:MAG: hypothetical protein KIS81_12295 [Maricaulaceae bacterium]|nr:hypothetical protein [Maricaulaceae bacterium]
MITLAAGFAALALAMADDPETPDAAPAAETPATETEAAPAPVLRLDVVETAAEAAPETDIVLMNAGQYAAYHRTLSGLRDAEIRSAADLDNAMDNLSAFFGEERLAQAWLSYAALIAEQHPEFVDEVRVLADYYGRDAAISGFLRDPAYASAFAGAQDAQTSVSAALAADADEIRALGERYRLAAYSLQSQRWAGVRARDRQDRLTAITLAGEAPIPVSDEITGLRPVTMEPLGPASLRYARNGETTGEDGFRFAGATPVQTPPALGLTVTVGETAELDRARIGRILSIAALRALENGEGGAGAGLEYLLSDPDARRCLTWARINLQQCVAAGHFKYEDSFCIAQHLLIDVSNCIEAAHARGAGRTARAAAAPEEAAN